MYDPAYMDTELIETPPPLILPKREQSPATTKARQKSFLVALSQCGIYRTAARLTGVEPHTISRWIKKSPSFKALADEAKAYADKYLVADAIEENFYQRAVAGKEDGQSAIIGMFTLKRINPAYRDNAVVHVNAQGPSAIQLNFNGISSLPTNSPVDNHVDR